MAELRYGPVSMTRTANVMTCALAMAVAAIQLSCANSVPSDAAAKRKRIAEMYGEYVKDFPEVRGVSADGLVEGVRSGEHVFVDTREEGERKISVIPGAITVEQFERSRLSGEDGRPVVVYCTVGYRSGIYADELRAKGVRALNLEGGILSWLHAGGEIVTPEGERTTRVHVYGGEWDLAPDGYETTY